MMAVKLLFFQSLSHGSGICQIESTTTNNAIWMYILFFKKKVYDYVHIYAYTRDVVADSKSLMFVMTLPILRFIYPISLMFRVHVVIWTIAHAISSVPNCRSF